MYPKNAASPPRIAIGAVVQISDGAVQSSGVSVVVRGEGGSETAGGGTVSYGASSSVVYYAPTQAETNYTAFVVTAYKTGCIPVSQTIVTTAASVSGQVDVWGISGDSTAADNAEAFFDGTGYAGTNNVIPTVTNLTNLPAITAGWLTAAGIAASALNGKGDWNVGKSGYTLVPTTGLGNQTANLTGSVTNVTGGINTGSGVIQTLDALDTQQDLQHGLTGTAIGLVQADLDIITGVDGVTLATAQGNYAPAKPADVATELATYDGPTNTEMTAAFTEIKGATWSSVTDTLEAIRDATGGGGDATLANQTTIITHLTDIKGTGFVTDTHSLTNVEGYADLIDDGTSGLAKIATDVAAILVDTADMQPKLGTPVTSVSADVAAVKVDTAATLVDTNELQTDWADGGRLDLILDARSSQASVDTVDGIVDGILVDTAEIGAAGAGLTAITGVLPAALIGGRMDSTVSAINNDTNAANRLALSAGQIIPATVDTVTNGHTPTTTELQADDITEATADHYNGRVIIFTSGALIGQATAITDYEAVGGIGQFTFVALTEAPTNNDTFIII